MTPNDRLSDEDLANARTLVPAECVGLLRIVDALVEECRAHRAAALSDEDMEALRWLAAQADTHLARCVVRQRALAILTRLTGGAP